MQLVVQSGAAADKTYPLVRNRMTIGRGPESDIYIRGDELISRRHAELIRQGQGWIVKDLGSRNGTRVNEQRIAGAQLLQAGDRLRVGHTTLELRGDAPLAVPEPHYQQVRTAGPVFEDSLALPKDAGMALILEVIPGLLGFPGFGWIYAGNTGRGIITLIGYWLLLGLEVLLGSLFSVVTLGLGVCLVLPAVIVVNGGYIGVSAHQLNQYVEHQNRGLIAGAAIR